MTREVGGAGEGLRGRGGALPVGPACLVAGLTLRLATPSAAWQGVERDLRSQISGSERGLVEEYVEKVPNPSLKTFKPIDLSDLKRRGAQDAKKS